MAEPLFIDTKEAARILGLSEGYVRTLCAAGKLPGFQLPGGRKWLIPYREFMERLGR